MRLVGLGLLAGILPLTGCTPSGCTGAGCGDVYNAARAGLLTGDPARWPELVDPMTDVDGAVVGSESDGNGWSPAIVSGGLFLGMPGLQAVHWFERDWVHTDNATKYDSLPGPSGTTTFGAALLTLPHGGRFDLIVGAPGDKGAKGVEEGGRLFGYADFDPILGAASPTWTLEGASAYDQIGEALFSCGDLDRDGLPDFAFQLPWAWNDEGVSGGISFVLSSRLGTGTFVPDDLGPLFTSRLVGARVGASLSCDVDFTGDGVPEVLVGASYADVVKSDLEGAGLVYLLDGAAVGEGVGGDLEDLAISRIEGTTAESYLGACVDVGDVSSDGIPDIVVGAPGDSDGRGKVFVYVSSGAGALPSSSTYYLGGTEDYARFGTTCRLDDYDGDSRLDLAVGAPRLDQSANGTAFSSGALYIWYGDAEGWAQIHRASEAPTLLTRQQAYLKTGGVFTSGDLDGDGASEILLVHEIDPTASQP